VSAKEGDVGNIKVAVADHGFTAVFIHREEGEHLIKRAFGIELHLRVLVGDSQALDRSLTRVDNRAVPIDLLARDSAQSWAYQSAI